MRTVSRVLNARLFRLIVARDARDGADVCARQLTRLDDLDAHLLCVTSEVYKLTVGALTAKVNDLQIHVHSLHSFTSSSTLLTEN